MDKQLDTKKLADKAVELFDNNHNCAQSVLLVYSDFLNLDNNTALSVSSGFGGGMGRLQNTCGVVTAAYMVFGLSHSKSTGDNRDKIAKTYSMVQKYHDKFVKLHGTTECKSLVNCDLTTEEGQKYFKQENLKENVCKKCVKDSVNLIYETISENTDK